MRITKEAPGGAAAPRSAVGLRIAVISSAFNQPVVDGLTKGALAALAELGAGPSSVTCLTVPGAFELPLAASAAARGGRFDAIVALGAVIRGETDHYEHVSRASIDGLGAVARETGVPVGLGVLTVRNEAQARARAAAGPENKGAEAARAAVAMAHVVRDLRGPVRRRRDPRARSS